MARASYPQISEMEHQLEKAIKKMIESLHERKVLHYIALNKHADRRTISIQTGISQDGVIGILRRLIEKELVKEICETKKKRYEPTNEGEILAKKEYYKAELMKIISSQEDLKKIEKIFQSVERISLAAMIKEGFQDPEGLFKSEQQLKTQVMEKRLKKLESELRRMKR